MARWLTGGKSVWPRRVRPASVTIARAVAAVAAGRVAVDLAAAAVAAGRAAAVTGIETEVEIAARVATTDKQNNSSAGQKTGATFFALGSFGQFTDPHQQLGWVGDLAFLGLHLS